MTDFVTYDDFGRGRMTFDARWRVGLHPNNNTGISVLAYADDHTLEYAMYGNPASTRCRRRTA